VAGSDGQALVHRQSIIRAQRCKNDHALCPLGPGHPKGGGYGVGGDFEGKLNYSAETINSFKPTQVDLLFFGQTLPLLTWPSLENFDFWPTMAQTGYKFINNVNMLYGKVFALDIPEPSASHHA
jgi:hypothetical protein